MNQFIKIVRRLILELSKIIYPSRIKVVKEITLKKFKIIANINEDVGRQLYLFGSFEKVEIEYFSKIIKQGDICFDVGGNIGYFSIEFSKLIGDGEVHVFEPIKSNVQMIEASISLNGLSNVIVNESAVGNENGFVKFSVSEDSAFSSIHDTGRKPLAEITEVKIVKLDTYFIEKKLSRIDILKIDVEGAEQLVVTGAEAILTDPNKRPRVVLIELYDLNLKGFGASRNEIINIMRNYGYSPFVISKNSELVELNELNHSRHYNVIFQPTTPLN